MRKIPSSLTESGNVGVDMAPGLSSVVVLAVYVILSPRVSAGDDCLAYTGKSFQKCSVGHCCGSCNSRYCCLSSLNRFDEDDQEQCINNVQTYLDPLDFAHDVLPIIIGVVSFVVIIFIIVSCCVCPCCCLYKMCRKPRPVIATTTQTTVVTTTPQNYPQHPTAVPVPSQSYQGMPFQTIPAQPGYPAQPMPTSPYHGQPFIPGPPPSYQEAISPAYPPQPMPYSQAVFNPGQPAYPLKPPAQPQPNAPPASTDFLAQPAYNPNFVAPPP